MRATPLVPARLLVCGCLWLGWGCVSASPEEPSAGVSPRPAEGRRIEHNSAQGELLGWAILEESDGRLARLVQIEPDRGQTGNDWVWCHLPTTSSLQLPDGRTATHPDLAEMEALRAGLAQDPPDVEGLIAGLSRLRRTSSRGALLEEVPPPDALSPPLRQAWLDAITSGRARWVLGPGPDGCPAGGSRDEALRPALLRAASWPGLPAERARQVLEAGLELGSYAGRWDVVRALLGRGDLLPVPVLAATWQELARDDAHTLLLELARREGLEPAEAREVLAAALRQSSYAWREDVLRALVGEGEGRELLSVPQVLAALEEVSREARHGLLLQLAARQSLTPALAARVLEDALRQSSYAWREDVLQALTGPGEGRGLLSVAQLLAAGDEVSRDALHALLLQLGRRSELSREEARAVLRAGLRQQSYAWRESVLRTLIAPPRMPGEPRALLSLEEVLGATGEISRDAGHELLLDLAQRPDLGPAQARLILRPALRQQSYAWREEVLVALVGRATLRGLLTVGEVVAAAEEVSREAKERLLLQLAGAEGLSPADARLVLNAGTTLSAYAGRTRVCLALVGKASAEDLARAARDLDRDGERQVLEALAGLKR